MYYVNVNDEWEWSETVDSNRICAICHENEKEKWERVSCEWVSDWERETKYKTETKCDNNCDI